MLIFTLALIRTAVVAGALYCRQFFDMNLRVYCKRFQCVGMFLFVTAQYSVSVNILHFAIATKHCWLVVLQIKFDLNFFSLFCMQPNAEYNVARFVLKGMGPIQHRRLERVRCQYTASIISAQFDPTLSWIWPSQVRAYVRAIENISLWLIGLSVSRSCLPSVLCDVTISCMTTEHCDLTPLINGTIDFSVHSTLYRPTDASLCK